MKDGVLPRAVAAALLMGAFATGVLFVDALPLIHPPAYGGGAHAAIALLVFGGLMTGMVFFASRWARAYAWACAIALGVFEFSYGLQGRLPMMGGPPLERSAALAAGAGVLFVLLSLPDLLAPKAESSGC